MTRFLYARNATMFCAKSNNSGLQPLTKLFLTANAKVAKLYGTGLNSRFDTTTEGTSHVSSQFDFLRDWIFFWVFNRNAVSTIHSLVTRIDWIPVRLKHLASEICVSAEVQF